MLRVKPKALTEAPVNGGRNYNGPKVGIPPSRHGGAAPPMGDHGTSSRLYAGKPGVSPCYSGSMSHHGNTVATWTPVKMHGVRKTSRKDSSPPHGWWVLSMERAASAARSFATVR